MVQVLGAAPVRMIEKPLPPAPVETDTVPPNVPVPANVAFWLLSSVRAVAPLPLHTIVDIPLALEPK